MNLKAIREARGLSQKQLAAELGIDRTTINKWEAGTNAPTASTLSRLADYFNVSTDYLLGRDMKTAPAGEPAEAAAPSREQMIDDIIRVYREMSDAEKLDFLARLNTPKAP